MWPAAIQPSLPIRSASATISRSGPTGNQTFRRRIQMKDTARVRKGHDLRIRDMIGMFLAGMLLLCAVCPCSLAARDRSLTIKGSDTMVILVQRWAEQYMKLNPDKSLQVTGGGSGTGI